MDKVPENLKSKLCALWKLGNRPGTPMEGEAAKGTYAMLRKKICDEHGVSPIEVDSYVVARIKKESGATAETPRPPEPQDEPEKEAPFSDEKTSSKKQSEESSGETSSRTPEFTRVQRSNKNYYTEVSCPEYWVGVMCIEAAERSGCGVIKAVEGNKMLVFSKKRSDVETFNILFVLMFNCCLQTIDRNVLGMVFDSLGLPGIFQFFKRKLESVFLAGVAHGMVASRFAYNIVDDYKENKEKSAAREFE